jgi:Sulfotransferase family
MPQSRIPPSTALRLPIFIVGTPRSGTTLLRLLLINHPDIAIPDETNIMTWLYKKPGKRRLLLPRASDAGNLTTAFGMNLAAEYDSLKRHKRPHSRRDKVAWFFERYAHQRGKQYWGDKTPGHAPYASELKDLFPQSTIVFMLRDPRAVVASFLRYKASSLRTESDFWICDTLEEAIKSYRRYILPGINLAEHLEFIRYEDLIAHPLSTLQQVSRRLGIEFAPQMLEARGSSESEFFEGTSKKGGALPEWKQGALGTIDPTLADNWRHELSAEQIAYTSDELSVFLSRFGYAHVAD